MKYLVDANILSEPTEPSPDRKVVEWLRDNDSAKALDKHYIPTRYPNGFAQGAPVDYYTKRDALDSLDHAKSILAFCQSEIRKPRPGSEASEDDGGTDSGQSS